MRIEVNSDVLFHSFGTEALLLDQSGETYFSLNESAARMWELLNDSKTPDEIGETVAREFDAPAGQIQADVEVFLGQLEELGIIKTLHGDG